MNHTLLPTKLWSCILTLSLLPITASAQQAPADAPDIKTVVADGVKLVAAAAARYPEHRKCFSCHHQTLPLLAMQAAQRRGVESSAEQVNDILAFSYQSFRTRKESLLAGSGIGGRDMTVAYGLWTLELAGQKPDDTTEAMVAYLLQTQRKDGTWTFQTNRPPLESSVITSTVLALYGLEKYASEVQQVQATVAQSKASDWLKQAECKSQEDRAFLLWGLSWLMPEGERLKLAKEEVWKAQREDGGWGQLDDMPSDAYATGQTLWALHEAGCSTTDENYLRGTGFLLRTRQKDGSWKVATRSRPIQTYFDNGDQHGKDQFISTPATSWATAALSMLLKEKN